MTAPKPNAELAYRVLDIARAHGEHFNMGDWGDSPDGSPINLDDLTRPDCGTTACLAGWTVALAGYRIDSHATAYDVHGNVVGGVAEMAGDMLGLSEDEADDLFYESTEGVGRKVAELFGPRPITDLGTGCRCDYLGTGTPQHSPSPLCISLRPDADRDEPVLGEAGEPS